MPKHASDVILELPIDTSTDAPLHRQVYAGIKDLILSGRLRPGARLPASRAMARDLGLSRTTILTAVDQLTLEGFTVGKIGSGTRVSSSVPTDRRRSGAVAPRSSTTESPPLSHRGRQLVSAVPRAVPATRPRVPLRPGYPEVDLFPLDSWARLTAKHWRRAIDTFAAHSDSLGYRPLREAICDHVWSTRAVRCEPDQVLITSGAQHALSLCAQTLADAGESVWIEDPGYPRARVAFASAGLQLTPVPVDRDGLDVVSGISTNPDARLIYVTPSFQCPLGVTLSLARRFELLGHAAQKKAWIIEDDYFSEYRHGRDPVASLQSLDTHARVIYIGNFSKTVVPFLRIGFVIAPAGCSAALKRARIATSRQPPGVDQAALAEFIADGHLQRHIAATLRVYRERQDALVDALRREAAGLLESSPAGTGMYLVGLLPPGVDDQLAVKAAAARNVDSVALSTFALRRLGRGALVLGYSGYEINEIRRAVKQLAAALVPLVEKRRGRRR
jgi:GntR family transcriptional regulator / MocR family aminotransferase